jgi:hypothetical protein
MIQNNWKLNGFKVPKEKQSKINFKDVEEHNEKVESTQWRIYNDDEVFGHETWVMMHNR